jgi:multiphosphoryl transfer protein
VIGLVLVSHSARLAEGVRELAKEMGGPDLRIGIAGGLDEPGHPLGTDAALVARVVDEVWSEDGVLVLMDLGSAVLSAELALELLPDDRRERVLLTEAPFVEGAVAAAVAAASGAGLEGTATEARGGLAGKVAHLASEAAPDRVETRPGGGAPATDARPGAAAHGAPGEHPGLAARQSLTLKLRVDLPHGLHARPAAALVRTAAAFGAAVTVADLTSGQGPVSAASLNAVATLGVLRGHDILVEAAGSRAAEALAAIRRLADGGFGEAGRTEEAAGAGDGAPAPTAPAQVPAPAAAAPGTVLHGLPASPGIAVGAARYLHAAPVVIPDGPGGDLAAELAALERALAETAADIRRSCEALPAAAAAEHAVFDAHLLFLEDEALLEPARRALVDDGVGAARAWADAVAEAAGRWDALDDPYQRARAADLRSVGDQVVRHLAGGAAAGWEGGPGILLADDLTPAEAAGLDRAVVLGVACAGGGPTSHAMILARSRGLPAVPGLGPTLLRIAEGTTVVLDGEAGTLIVDPAADELADAELRRRARAHVEKVAAKASGQPAVTIDSVVVPVLANISGPADAASAVAAGADGVGLLRTEFLFLEGDHLPDEDEQEQALRLIAETLGGRPLTVRTLDVGADKQLAFLRPAREQNPFLGVRGLRLGLEHPELLLAQLRAILRVAVQHPLRVMLPMVTTLEEVVRARGVLDEATTSLPATPAAAGRLQLGVMIEVPAAALTATALARHVDFFSIGTNDLAQYTLAAERGNAAVAALADPLHPAVLQLVRATAAAAEAEGRAVAVCGEVAGDPPAIPLLLGLGATELSVAPARIPLAKQAVRETDLAVARALAAEALAASSAQDVRRLLTSLADPDAGRLGS